MTRKPATDSNGNRTGSGRKPRVRQPRKRFPIDSLFTAALANLIKAVLTHNGAIRFGMTRDGAVLSMGVYGDGEPYTDYLATEEEWLEWCDEMIERFESSVSAEDYKQQSLT